jgi:hypothetical protein
MSDATRLCCGTSILDDCACPPVEHQLFYREENARWASDRLAITCIEFRVVRRTPKGQWITPTWNADDTRFLRFVLDGKGKRYAYPTREEARASFIIRKQREIQHCAAQHDRAKRYLALAQTMQFGTKTEAVHELRTPDEMIAEAIFAAEPPRAAH